MHGTTFSIPKRLSLVDLDGGYEMGRALKFGRIPTIPDFKPIGPIRGLNLESRVCNLIDADLGR